MVETLYENILKKLPHIYIHILYFLLFFPIILSNVVTVLAFIFLPILMIVVYFVPSKYLKSISTIGEDKDSNNSSIVLGQIIRKIQIKLTKEFPIKIIKTTTLLSIQKLINKFYFNFFGGYLKGLMAGIKSNKQNRQNNEKKSFDILNLNIFLKILLFPVYVTVLLLFLLYLYIPTILLLLPLIGFVIICVFLK